MTTVAPDRTSHADQVGTIEDLGTLDALPKRAVTAPPGRGRQFNPFDDKVVETFESGRPRLAVADDLASAKVLIRRAAAHAGLGIDIVPTVAPDGRDAIAYLAREKRETKKADAAATSTPDANPAEADDVESFDEDADDQSE